MSDVADAAKAPTSLVEQVEIRLPNLDCEPKSTARLGDRKDPSIFNRFAADWHGLGRARFRGP
jgi:hypothetical protein